MSAVPFDIKKGKPYIPHILLIGISIGTANYLIHGILNWFQWIIQSSSTSLLVGYALVTLASNKAWFNRHFKSTWQQYLVLSIAFILTGALASEIEQIIKTLVFNNGTYSPFSGGRIYLFNSIISLALGFSFFLNANLFPKDPSNTDHNQEDKSDQKNAEESLDPILKVPVKQGENILLVPVEEIAYFEAFDNYSFVYDLKGNKILWSGISQTSTPPLWANQITHTKDHREFIAIQ